MKIPAFLYGWDFSRIFRLALAILVAVLSIGTGEYSFLVLSGWFLIQAIFNISCCGVGGCATSYKKSESDELADDKTVKFEEIK